MLSRRAPSIAYHSDCHISELCGCLLQVVGTHGSVGQKERYLRAAAEHRVRFRLLAREVCSLLEPLAPSSLPADANPDAGVGPSAAPTGVLSPTLVATVPPGAAAVHGPFVLSGQKMCVGSHTDAEKMLPTAAADGETVLLVAARRRLDEYKDTVRKIAGAYK